MDGPDIATLRGLVDARLELEDPPLDVCQGIAFHSYLTSPPCS